MKANVRIWLTLVLAFIMVITASCSAPAATGTGDSKGAVDPKKPVTVTIWLGSWWAEQVPKIVDAYKKDHPNVTLQIETLPINGYLDKAISSTLGGNPPDVLDLDINMISTMAGKNLLTPWDEQIKSLDIKDFDAGAWGSSQYNGKTYAIPNRASNVIYYYNKKMFDDAGVPYPTEEWTYDDMLKMAQKLTKGDQYGIGIASAASDISNVFSGLDPLLWAMGGDFFDKNGKFILNEPNGVKALTYWSELYTKHKVVPTGTLNYTIAKDLVPQFTQNKVALIMAGSQYIEQFTKDGVKFGFVAPPQKFTKGGGWAFTVPVQAKSEQAAKDFILWFIESKNLSELQVRQPARYSATTSPPWNSDDYKRIISYGKFARTEPTIPQWGQVQNIILTELQKIMGGNKSVQQGADDMAKQVNELMNKK